MSNSSVEELTLSLVREFLSRKGLKATLVSLDQEIPRTEESISNRGALAKAVGMEKLMRKNKEQVVPYRTILEVVVKWLLTKSSTSHDRLSVLHDQPSPHHKQHSSHPQTHKDHSTPATSSEDPHTNAGTKSIQSGHAHPTHGKPITYTSHTSSQVRDESSKKPEALPSTDSLSLLKQNPYTKRSSAQSLVSGGAIQTGLKTTSKKFKPRSFTSFESRSEPLGDDRTGVESSMERDDLLSGVCSRRPTSSLTPHPKKGESVFGDFEFESSVGSKVMPSEQSSLRGVKAGVSRSSNKSTPLSGDFLMCEDLENQQLDTGVEWSSNTIPSVQNPPFPKGRPITIETAKALRQLLFGTSKGPSFSSEWRQQNFVFSDIPGLQYGLVQHKGGPCGVLAAVQAFLLKHLMFADPHTTLTNSPHPSPEERRESLVAALGDILWRAGGGKRAIVALLSVMGVGSGKTTPTYQPDHITEKMVEHEFVSREVMESFLRAKLPLFEDKDSCGCIQFLLSVLLTKGVANVRSEMDEKNGRLIGAHGYCTQELVSLLLTGVAVSNVFDGDVELPGSDGGKLVLRGLREKSEVGLLSLFEHYQSCKVGSYYKEPVYPIWVVCSESHFSVIFSTQKQLLKDRQQEQRFDLYYYDGLANQDEEIRLSIDIRGEELPLSDKTLTPPLELCIRTKWPSATVHWNGTDPIL